MDRHKHTSSIASVVHEDVYETDFSFSDSEAGKMQTSFRFGEKAQKAVVPLTNHQVIEMEQLSERFMNKPLVKLQFSNLTYTVKTKDSGFKLKNLSRKFLQKGCAEATAVPGNEMFTKLLHGVSGEARDGEILAVMGPSGSGKSTLIDALALRISRESLQGSIKLNGEDVTAHQIGIISAYVMQDDLLFPMLTVQETLMFSADVRLPKSQSKEKKRERVKVLLDQLGLNRVANTIIGDEGHRGVSGGERRRVSIGIDIVHDPLILFLDEPTSGLDSTSAFMVVKTLQKIAQSGSMVILSIHQPSYRILGLLDRLIFLAHGQAVYNGPPSELNSFFASFGRPIPEHENSTEFAIDLIQEMNSSEEGIGPLVRFCKNWYTAAGVGKFSAPLPDIGSAIRESIKTRGKLVAAASQGFDGSDGKKGLIQFANPFWIEILVLVKRSLINIRRTPELFLTRLATVMVTGFLLATIFWKLDDSPKGVQERLGFFAFAMSTTFYTCADALPVFLQERYIFMRETAHNAYRKSSYTLANAIIYIPFLAMLSIAFAVTIWWAVGLNGGASGFLFFYLIIWASFWAGNSFVTFLSAIIPNVMLGFTIVVAILAYFLLLSGFFISRDRIPKYWIWFHFVSLIKYPYEAVLINEFGRSTACFETGAEILYGTPLQSKVNQTTVQAILKFLSDDLVKSHHAGLNSSTCVITGHEILKKQHVTQLSKWSCLFITLAFGVFFRTLFYICLRLNGKNKRR